MPEALSVIQMATMKGMRIAVAESLTGGMLTSALVDVPGASAALSGGVVAYDTEVKRSVLGVDAEILRERGPVDAEVARQMARGVRETLAVRGLPNIGIATTGVAGPDPDPQSGQPAGTVWVGVSSSRGERSVRLELSGDRARIRAASVLAGLRELQAELEALPAQ